MLLPPDKQPSMLRKIRSYRLRKNSQDTELCSTDLICPWRILKKSLKIKFCFISEEEIPFTEEALCEYKINEECEITVGEADSKIAQLFDKVGISWNPWNLSFRHVLFYKLIFWYWQFSRKFISPNMIREVNNLI